MTSDKAAQSGGAAISVSPGTDSALKGAIAAYRASDFATASKLCNAVLEREPDSAGARHLMGLMAYREDRYDVALQEVQRAIEADPGAAAFYFTQGNIFEKLNRFDEALSAYGAVIRLKPDHAKSYFNRALIFQKKNCPEDALESYSEAILKDANLAEAYNNRGNVLRNLGRSEEAVEDFRKAISRKPDFSIAFNNQGNALRELRRLDEALESFNEAIRLGPSSAEALYNRGNIFVDLERFEEALEDFESAIRTKPDYALAYLNRGNTLKRLRRYGAAIQSYEHAIQINPELPFLRGVIANLRSQICRWDRYSENTQCILDGIRAGRAISPPFSLLAMTDDLAHQRQAARKWFDEQVRPSGACGSIRQGRNTSKKLHIAYLSADFYDHATSYLMAELFELHDRERFEVTAISWGPDRAGSTRERLVASFDRFEDVRRLTDLDVAKLCRKLEIDIAVDLKGYTHDCRPGILAERCAPIQINWLGYPGTMAAPFIDYIIADSTLITESDLEYYSEKVVWLPDTYQVNDRKRIIADKDFTRETCGLPVSGFVYCCFNNNYKILPSTFDVWMRVLSRVPGSVLWLLGDNESAEINLRKEAAARGIDPLRLVFAKRLPHAEHLARHSVADLFIDTWPYNAHTTASDALWAGLPVLTKSGQSFASRVAASLLNAVGLPELVTRSDGAFENLAVDLAFDSSLLHQYRERLRTNRYSSPLFDCERFTRNIESAYQQVFDRYCAGQEPTHFRVEQRYSATKTDPLSRRPVNLEPQAGRQRVGVSRGRRLRININDPGLRTRAGHHFDLDYRLVKRLVALGFDVHIYAHKLIDLDVKQQLAALAPVTPCFSISPYSPPSRYDPIAGSHLLFQDTTDLISTELAQTRVADTWFWPTIFAGQLNACARLIKVPPIAACVHVPLGVEFGQLGELWRLALINSKRAGLKLNIGGIEEQLRKLFNEVVLAEDFRLFPAPHDGSLLHAPKQACRIIGMLGHQRPEKGRLPFLHEVSRALVAQGFEVVLQNSAGALDAREGVRSFGFVENFPSRIAECDLIVLPYDRHAYQHKGSGVLWEALATGVPTVVTSGTAQAVLVGRLGTGVEISDLSAESILRAIELVCLNYSGLAQKAFDVAIKWRSENSTDRFIEALLGREIR